MNATVSSKPLTVPLAESMGGDSSGSPSPADAMICAVAMATRVTLTALPLTLNSQMGAVAGPRVVWIGPDVSVASVRTIGTQSEHGATVVELIEATACCA